VPLSVSQETVSTPPEGTPGSPVAHRETSFTHLPAAAANRGAYTSLPTEESTSARPSPPLAQSAASRSRWVSGSLASSRSDLVSESKSTEPLLPGSPTTAALDLEGIPPPPRPYSGPAPPPLPPPPPHPYSDRTLPLNAGQLRGLQQHHHHAPAPPPSSYANIGMLAREGQTAGGGQPRDVMIHAAGKKNFSTSEISV
jgi:hypothetical protein